MEGGLELDELKVLSNDSMTMSSNLENLQLCFAKIKKYLSTHWPPTNLTTYIIATYS